MSVEILGHAFASTRSVLANVSSHQLDEATPCASWKVRELVNHVVGGATFFAVTVETGAAPMGGEPTDFTAGDFCAAFAQGAVRAVAAFSAEGAMEKTMKLSFGELPGSVFVWIAATDTFTHGWDLAKATGQSTDLNPVLAEQLYASAQANLPDALRGPEPKPFGPAIDVAAGAPAADRLAGYLGRRP